MQVLFDNLIFAVINEFSQSFICILNFRLRKVIGSGQFGMVMKGEWLLPGRSKEVAVKSLKEGSSEEDKVKFLQKAAINGQFWHPNVIKLMGVVTVGEPVS